jgi:transcription antitermination factor NusG
MLSTLFNGDKPISQTGSQVSVAGAPEAVQKWFAAYTAPCHEKRVAQHLSLRQIEYFLPLYRVRRQWRDGSKVVLELPLFPGYIFVRIKKEERVPVLQVPKVLAIVQGLKREPAPLADSDIESLRAGLGVLRAEPYPFLTVGQRARIKSGPLAGKEGLLIGTKNNTRLVITLDLIMQSIAVEIDANNLEPLAISSTLSK